MRCYCFCSIFRRTRYDPADRRWALAAGTDEPLRERLFEAVRRNPRVFNRRDSVLQTGFTHLHDYRYNLLEEGDFDNWDGPSVPARIRTLVSSFVENGFPKMDEVISACLT